MRSDESRMKDRIKSYVEWMKEHSSFYTHHSSFKYAVDCSNGMASLLVHELFPDAIVINDTLDGTFPNHSPNPLKAEAREQIASLVRAKGLDCGVIFDGDADRCMFVDERGEFVQPDYLIPIVARATIDLTQRHRDTEKESEDLCASVPLCLKIIHDVRTSRGAIEELKRMGCEPVMVPVGHAFAKPTLRKVGAVCGGELAGHYYFSEFFGCDSGVLAALRILGVTFDNQPEIRFGVRLADVDPPLGVFDANAIDLAARKLPRQAFLRRLQHPRNRRVLVLDLEIHLA